VPNDFPKNDLQSVWQNQTTEDYKMSADTLRHKAQQLDRKARSAVLISAAIAVVLFVYFGWGAFVFDERFQRFSLGAAETWTMRLGFGVLSLWSLFSGYKAYKVFWPSSMASNPDPKATVQAYKQQLEKQRDYSRKIWLRSGLIFCFLGMAMVVIPIFVRDITSPLQLLKNVGPILALFVLWLAIFIPQRKRRLRKLNQEIDQLRALQS
jgi:hypothetical protein